MQLKDLAYEFYPKGVFETPDPIYAESPEQLRFKAKKNESIRRYHSSWTQLISALKKHFGETKVENLESLLYGNEKSFPVCVAMTTDEGMVKNLVLHISVLINFYLIYQSDPNIALTLFEPDPSIALFVPESKYVSHKVEKSLEPAYLFIKQNVVKYFPEFSEFPHEFLENELPDIMHDGVGVFEKDSLNVLPDWKRKMTIFKAFFSSRHYAVVL